MVEIILSSKLRKKNQPTDFPNGKTGSLISNIKISIRISILVSSNVWKFQEEISLI